MIWRIEQGELDGIAPKVVVLMIGTNNTVDNTAEEIAAADRKIVQLIQQHLPTTKILLLAIFPRGPRQLKDGTPEPWEKKMAIIHAVNAGLAKLDDGQGIRYLDINARFLSNDGVTIPHDCHAGSTPSECRGLSALGGSDSAHARRDDAVKRRGGVERRRTRASPLT